MIKLNRDDLTFHVTPRDQGQAVTVSYAATEDGYVRATHDGSTGETAYEWASFDDVLDVEGDAHKFEPWNGYVPDADGIDWEPCEVR